MTHELRADDELIDLLDRLCDDRLSDPDEARLQSLLEADPDAREVYQQYLAMHAELYWLQETVSPAGGIPGLNGLGLSLDNDFTGGNSARPGWVRWASLAAVLLVGSALGFVLAGGLGGGKENSATRPDRRMERVAEVTGSLNCRWKTRGEEESIGFGSPLYSGQELELVKGVAEITFQNGTRMIVQAPARLDVSSFAESVLHEGRLTATCPPGAEGFRINTAGLTLIDRGTEFGVMTDRDGNTEVHVFDGLVEGLYREAGNGRIQKVQWRTNETIHYSSSEAVIEEVAQPTSPYLRTLAPSLGPMNGVLASEDFEYPVGPLNSQNGGFGWGGPWQDITVQEGHENGNVVSAGRVGDVRLSNGGNHASLQGNFNRIRRVLNTSIGGVFDNAGLIELQDGARLIGRDGTSLYLSFTQQVSDLDQVFYGFELNRGDGNRNRVICIGHGAARSWTEGAVRTPDKEAGVTGWAVTSEFNGREGLLELGELGQETTREVFVVVKLTFGEAHDDLIEVYVNPGSLWDETACQPDAAGRGNFAFDRIGLANFEGNKTYDVDHIRIGTSFPAVTRPLWTGNRESMTSVQAAEK